MANISRLNGFRPVYHLGGAHIQSRLYFIPSTDATAVYLNDVVKLAGSSDTAGVASTVQLAAAADAVVGVVVGFLPDPTNLNIDGQYRKASTARYVWIVDDPMVVFEVEASNGILANTDVGNNIKHAVGTPSATTGQSGAYVDAGTKDTTAAYTFKILAFSSRVDNDDTVTSSKVYVKINNHQFGSGTGTTGL